jgi:hypothetical protein
MAGASLTTHRSPRDRTDTVLVTKCISGDNDPLAGRTQIQNGSRLLSFGFSVPPYVADLPYGHFPATSRRETLFCSQAPSLERASCSTRPSPREWRQVVHPHSGSVPSASFWGEKAKAGWDPGMAGSGHQNKALERACTACTGTRTPGWGCGGSFPG